MIITSTGDMISRTFICFLSLKSDVFLNTLNNFKCFRLPCLPNSSVKANGAKITIKGFVRYETGDGIEKRQDDFAAEVAAQVAGK